MRGQKPTAFEIVLEAAVTKRLLIKCLLRDQSGTSAIEYGMIIALLSIVIIGALQGLSNGVGAVWDTATTATNKAISPSNG